MSVLTQVAGHCRSRVGGLALGGATPAGEGCGNRDGIGHRETTLAMGKEGF
jgi:hypothetical protein